jgi:hypothetical protein
MFGREKKPDVTPQAIEEEFPGEAEKVLQVKNLCWIAKMSAEAYDEMSNEDKQDEFGQYEYKRYREYMSKAINLARELRDTFYRDAALHQLILLLMVAKEEKLAKDLYKVGGEILGRFFPGGKCAKRQKGRDAPDWQIKQPVDNLLSAHPIGFWECASRQNECRPILAMASNNRIEAAGWLDRPGRTVREAGKSRPYKRRPCPLCKA